jgi:hypothetical protein
VLNHVEAGVTKVYDRYTYDDEKRGALERWSHHLTGVILKGDKAHKHVLAFQGRS